MSKYCNVFTVKSVSYEMPEEYLNQDCAIIEIIGDCANVLFDDDSTWFVSLKSLEASVYNNYG